MRNRRVALIVAMLCMGFVFGFAVSASTAERHPEIRKAQKALAQAKDALEHAAHDFGGHRVKAIEHIDQAQDELRMALEDAAH